MWMYDVKSIMFLLRVTWIPAKLLDLRRSLIWLVENAWQNKVKHDKNTPNDTKQFRVALTFAIAIIDWAFFFINSMSENSNN
jgi:hypothetical protein